MRRYSEAVKGIPGSSDLSTFADFSAWHKVVDGKRYATSLNIEARKA